MKFHYFQHIVHLKSHDNKFYFIWEQLSYESSYFLTQHGLMELEKIENHVDPSFGHCTYFHYPGKILLAFEDMGTDDFFFNDNEFYQKVDSCSFYVPVMMIEVVKKAEKYVHGLEERLEKLEAHLNEHLLFKYGGEGYLKAKADFETRRERACCEFASQQTP